jgi:predicted alpha/beta hydrolase family esterase
MGVGTVYRVSSYSNPATENVLLWQLDPSVTLRGVLMCHGYNAVSYDYLITYRQEPYQIARSFPVFCPDAAGGNTWGNDNAQTALGGAFTQFTAFRGVKTDKVVVYGGSMGCLNACNWAMANPTLVAGIILVLPAVSLQDLHDNRYVDAPTNSNPIGPHVETAYGGLSAYQTALPTHDPNTTANRTTLSQFPIQMHYSTNDLVAIPSIATDFATATGAAIYSMGAIGHSAGTLNYDLLRNFVNAHG